MSLFFYIASSVVLLILGFGLIVRKNRDLHIKVMTTAFVLDVLLVLIIEIQRHAVEKVVTQHLQPILLFHVIVSLLVVVGYVWQVILGRKILANVPNARTWHMYSGAIFMLLRLTNYVTSFMLPQS